MRSLKVFIVAFTVFLSVAAFALAPLSDYEVDCWVFASGGVEVQNGDFSLLEVLGQPAVGPTSGGDFEVEAGFLNEDSASVPVELITFTVE